MAATSLAATNGATSPRIAQSYFIIQMYTTTSRDESRERSGRLPYTVEPGRLVLIPKVSTLRLTR